MSQKERDPQEFTIETNINMDPTLYSFALFLTSKSDNRRQRKMVGRTAKYFKMCVYCDAVLYLGQRKVDQTAKQHTSLAGSKKSSFH